MARAMKDSRVEWVGKIPATWEATPLKYLTSYNDDVVDENTDDDFEFDYIDIGSVEYGKGITQLQHMRYKEAPSRARRIVRTDDVILNLSTNHVENYISRRLRRGEG